MSQSEDLITCEICGGKTHAIKIHLKKNQCREDITFEEYVGRYPSAPTMSQFAKDALERQLKEKADALRAQEEENAKKAAEAAQPVKESPIEKLANAEKDKIVKRDLDKIFELKGAEAKNKAGAGIPVSCVTNPTHPDMVPKINNTYVYDINDLKNVLMGIELKLNTYVFGHKGTGKSELFEQIAARTGRPFCRVQHTANTEEAHIVGMWTVKNNEMTFELGPLALAMKYGWMFLADEYDFASPAVLSVYQAVLEGKALMIKEADAANRIIEPHPNFTFAATGNTNGTGDETGMYAGTNIQNSANYDRFGMTLEKKYMPKKQESLILQNHCGLTPDDANNMVEFASKVREAYDGNKINDTISPRALISASRIGVGRGSFMVGVELAFLNKLSRADKETVKGLAQRVFG